MCTLPKSIIHPNNKTISHFWCHYQHHSILFYSEPLVAELAIRSRIHMNSAKPHDVMSTLLTYKCAQAIISWLIELLWMNDKRSTLLTEPDILYFQTMFSSSYLIHWGRVTYICVGKLTIIGSDNGLSHGQRQAIIWTNARILLFGPLGTFVSEISIGILTFSIKLKELKMSSAKWCPFCLSLSVLICHLTKAIRLWWT